MVVLISVILLLLLEASGFKDKKSAGKKNKTQ